MANRELLSLGPMDTSTPHGKAQGIFNSMLEIAEGSQTPVSFRSQGEPHEPSPLGESARTAIIFDIQEPPKTPPINTTDLDPKPTKRKQRQDSSQRPKTHDTKGLNGFYHGTFYRDGAPQQPKNKRGK